MPIHIDGVVLHIVLTDVPDVVEVRVDSLVGTSDHFAVSIDVLEQPVPHLVCCQEVISRTLWTESWLEEI